MADASKRGIVSTTTTSAARRASAPHPAASPELQRILSKLRPFQKDGFDFATNEASGRCLIADEMGCGKTCTALAVMTNYIEDWPLLILCPASLRHMWPAEIEKFIPSLPHSAVYVVSGFDDADFYTNRNKRDRIKIVVATYSLLQNRSAAARVLEQFDFRCVIADESHNLKERNSQRCKLAMPLLIKAERVCLLSGTPALARPVELWAQLHCLAPRVFGSYTAFTKKFCNAHRGRFGWDVKGVSNADELHKLLKKHMIRRLKCDVLKDLPPKQRTIVPVKISSEHAAKCRILIEEMDAASLSIADLVGEEADAANFEARKMLMQAYQASGIAKAAAVAEYLVDWLAGSGTQKVLVFAHHKEVLDTLEAAIARKMKGVGHIRIDGTVAPAERSCRVRKFQSQAKVRVALLSVTAAGVGLTLTAASSVIFAELHWTPGVLAQAEDRCHRIGQDNAVNVMYCCCKEREISIDMKLWNMLAKKVGTLGRVIDGKKFASMNAVEQQEGSKGGDGVSAEDEIQSFFAQSTPSVAASTPSKPVKGSIESFFSSGRKNGNSTSISNGAASKTPTFHFTKSGDEKSSKARSYKPESATPLGKSFFSSSKKKAPPARQHTVTWSCAACTYLNERPRITATITPLSCEICGTAAAEESIEIAGSDTSSPTVETAPLEKEEIVVVDYGDPQCSSSSASQEAVSSSSSGIIEIDDSSDSDNYEEEKPAHVRARKANTSSSSSSSSSVVLLDSDNEDDICDHGQKEKKASDMDILSFAVSKNSGRVAIHSSFSGEPLHVNFDIDQVLAESTADLLLEMQTKRLTSGINASMQLLKTSVTFEEKAVTKVVESINLDLIGEASVGCDLDKLCTQLKSFVSSFLTLREVEKKALSGWGRPTTANSLFTDLASLMAPSISAAAAASTTDRYSGGFKERALENLKKNSASDQDLEVLNGTACAWCGTRLGKASLQEGVESTYCSTECAEEGRLKRGGMFASSRLRAQVFALERGVCSLCGIDANALFIRISALQPAERLNALCNANWRLPQSRSALERLLQKPKEGDFWQCDHEKAVAEGGGSCGLDNLRTLCTPCHKKETDKLRARLRLTGGPSASEPKSTNHDGATQMDIRSVFPSSSGSSNAITSERKKKRRKRTAD